MKRTVPDRHGTGRTVRAPASDRAFRPAWWLPGPHLPTLWVRFGRRHVEIPVSRARWTTPDGDFLDLDFVDGPAGAPTLLVLHGLEGCSESKYARGLLALARDRGWRGAALNFRFCSGTPNRAPRLYHSGETGDVDWVVDQLRRREPGAPLVIVGVSLGGNVLLKWLGERGNDTPDELRAAATISAPFDLEAGARRLSRGLGRVYTRFFLRTLKAKALEKERQYPGRLDRERVRKARTWRAYDDAVTAPLHGFEDADDYWAHSSSGPFLGRIRRPVLLINARNDPFFPADALPQKQVERSDWLHAEFTRRGGHVGFVAGPPWRPRYWAEERAVEFLARFVPTLRPVRAPRVPGLRLDTP